MSEKRYLVVLSGIKDLDVKIVNQDVWNWIFSPYAGDIDLVPEAVLAEARLYGNDYMFFEDEDPESGDPYFNVSNTYENDRAMAAPGPSFWSMKDALKYIRDNDIEIESEYEGCLY